MLLYKENGSEVYLFSSFIKAMYEKKDLTHVKLCDIYLNEAHYA